jgi:hypothetical protein
LQLFTETIPDEFRALICCARKSLTEADRGLLAELIRKPLDWDFLSRLAGENGLVPLLEKHVLELHNEDVPPQFLSKLSGEARENAIRTLFLAAELLRVLDALGRSRIPAIPFKGPELAARAYGDVSLRRFDDLDIAIPQKFAPAALDTLVSMGYDANLPRERFESSNRRTIPGEYAFTHARNRARVEIHTEYTLRHFPAIPDLEAMIGRSTDVLLNGKKTPAFAAEDELLLLAVHGAKDFWARLLWVADVAGLVERSQEILWEDLLARADSLKVARMLRVSLILARKALGLSPPDAVVKQIENDRVARRLAEKVISQWLGRPISQAGIFARSTYRIRSVDGLWNGLRYGIRLSTSPAEEDWTAMEVPRPLRRSDVLLRPLRLWRKYGQGVSRSGRET